MPDSPITDTSVPAIIPRASLEQMLINKAIVDGAFRAQLIADPNAALQDFLGRPLPPGLTVRVYVEDATTFYYVTPNTDPELDQFTTETGTAPMAMSLRASFVGRLNYLLSPPDNPPVGDLQSAFENMQTADAQAQSASDDARDAEVQAALAGDALESAEILLEAANAAVELVPSPSNDQAVQDAQATLNASKQIYDRAVANARSLRATAVDDQQNALIADGSYEDVLRATFQQQFAANPVTALNDFLNLVTPFTAYATILDSGPVGDPPPALTHGMRFTHLVETTGNVLFIVLPYTTNQTLFMGPYSINFNGTSSYIQVPISDSLLALSTLAVEAWVWSDGFRSGYSDVVVSTLANGGGWQLEVGGGIPKFTVILDGVAHSITADNDPALRTGKWHYLVGILNEGQLFLYVNGSQRVALDVSGNLTPGGDLLMGRNAALQADQSFFQGMLHEVRLWGDALTHDVILDSIPAQPGVTSFPTPLQEALLAHYLFDEGVNFNALDDSPNHNDGVMVNAVWKITGQDSPAQH